MSHADNPLVAAIELLATTRLARIRRDAEAVPPGAEHGRHDPFASARQAAIEWLLTGKVLLDDDSERFLRRGDTADWVQRTDRALAALRDRGPEAWIDAYEALTALRPHIDGGRVRLEADRRGRKRRGSWYTPPAIVEAVLDRALEPALARCTRIEQVRRLRIVDPAAGPGRFLVGAARRIAARLVALGAVEPHARNLAARCIWGADIDGVALRLARGILEDFAGGRVEPLAERLMVGDALGCPAGVTNPALLHPRDVVPWPYLGRFDVVIGNPPYRAGRLAGLDRMRALFPSAEYQLDPYLLFLEQASHIADGRMALVVPTTWMSNHRCRHLRRLLLENHCLESVVEVPVEAFDAAVETAVPIFSIGRGPTVEPVPVLDLVGERVATVHPDPDDLEAPLPLTRTARARGLLVASRGWPMTLGRVCEINRGINPYHHTTHSKAQIAARVHHSGHRVDDGWSPELRGRDLPGAYRLDWKGDHWIHYGPWLKEPRAARFFEGPRILVRKILGETLHGVYVDRPFYCDQSVYIARIRDGCPYPAHALLACVNSRLIATLIRSRHQTHRTHFPQLKVGELRDMPLPPAPADDPRWAALGELAERMQASPDDALGARIEAMVAALYDVRPA